MRVGDVERDECASVLIEHHLKGRLSVEELEQRQRLALEARTDTDLDALLFDLPRTRLPRAGSSRTTFPKAAALRARRPARPDRVPSDRGNLAARLLIPTTTILGGAYFANVTWEFATEGVFYGSVLGGVIGYAAHAVNTRLRP